MMICAPLPSPPLQVLTPNPPAKEQVPLPLSVSWPPSGSPAASQKAGNGNVFMTSDM